MVFAMGSPVRPTKFCIDECLDGKFPAINTPLSEMKHPLVQLAQTIPPDNGKRLRRGGRKPAPFPFKSPARNAAYYDGRLFFSDFSCLNKKKT